MQQKYKFILALAIVVAAGVAVYLMMGTHSKAASFEIADGSLKITGAYGVTVPLAEITGLEKKDVLPAIERKDNGSGLGSLYKGEFTLAGGTKARLYVDASKPPFVCFTQGGVVFYLNAETPEQTQQLYDRLAQALKP